MKQFYSIWLLLAVCHLTIHAQSLNPGQITDNIYNKEILTQRFALGNCIDKKSTDDATAASAGRREINFAINYDADANSFTSEVTPDSTQDNSGWQIAVTPHSRFNRTAQDYQVRHINFMQLKIALGSDHAAVIVSNLKLNGRDITGSYSANTSGNIYWSLIYGEFGSAFTITGTINVLSNEPALGSGNAVELSFGSSSNLSPAALSVYWGAINAGQTDNTNTINWNTDKEINNDRFIIERATDGLNFAGIGLVTGVGNRNAISNYTFTDKDFTAGNNFYRLKQVDMDGHVSYSVVVHILNENAGAGPLVDNGKKQFSAKSQKQGSSSGQAHNSLTSSND